MNLFRVVRFSHGERDTLGALLAPDGSFLCFTLEDERRETKIRGQTRIPEGTYELDLRTTGGKHEHYSTLYSFHEGMIWVKDVPNFKFVLWHVGNVHADTAGCLLLGDQAVQNVTEFGQVLWSDAAYRRVYPQVLAEIQSGPTFVRYEVI